MLKKNSFNVNLPTITGYPYDIFFFFQYQLLNMKEKVRK